MEALAWVEALKLNRALWHKCLIVWLLISKNIRSSTSQNVYDLILSSLILGVILLNGNLEMNFQRNIELYPQYYEAPAEVSCGETVVQRVW